MPLGRVKRSSRTGSHAAGKGCSDEGESAQISLPLFCLNRRTTQGTTMVIHYRKITVFIFKIHILLSTPRMTQLPFRLLLKARHLYSYPVFSPNRELVPMYTDSQESSHSSTEQTQKLGKFADFQLCQSTFGSGLLKSNRMRLNTIRLY